MSKCFEFFVGGCPQPDAKRILGKIKKFGKWIWTIIKRDPKGRIKAWEETVKRAAIAYMALEDRDMFEAGEPLVVTVDIWMPQAKSNKTKFHTQTPDTSNLYYLPENALKGICYHDDSQVVHIVGKKKWEFHESEKHSMGIWVTVERVKEDWK